MPVHSYLRSERRPHNVVLSAWLGVKNGPIFKSDGKEMHACLFHPVFAPFGRSATFQEPPGHLEPHAFEICWEVEVMRAATKEPDATIAAWGTSGEELMRSPDGSPPMTRRDLLQSAALFAAPLAPAPESRLEIPLHRVMDKNARCGPAQIRNFFSTVWDEAVHDFAKGGITFSIVERTGEVLRYPSGKPLFKCLDRGMINVVLTDRVPVDWDTGRSLAGAATLYEGFCVCVISMTEAHGNQIPFLAVNTVLHELLHIFLQDVFVSREGVVHGQSREARVDMYATRLWLFGDGAAVRQSARACLKRLPGSATRIPETGPCPSIYLRTGAK
jgi:hypothetical protein